MLVWYSWSSWWFVWSSSWFRVHVDGEEVHDFRGWGWMRKWMRFEEDLPLVHVACVWFSYLACISSTWRRCPSGPLMLPIPVVLRLWVGLLCVWLYCACALVWFVACLPLLWAGRCVTDVSEPDVYVVSLWWDVWPSECCHHHDSPLWNQKFISLLFHRNWCLVLAQDVVISFYGCPWSGLFFADMAFVLYSDTKAICVK